MRPFRFWVRVGPSRSKSEWMDKARKIEALGYDTLVVPDHLADFLAPVPALISAADATNQLRVGTNVFNNDYRHPVLLAREAATIDLLTDGRFQPGLGAGNVPSEYHQAGMKFEAGATRVARLAEAVTIIKGLLQGETVTFTGSHYRVTAHASKPVPIQKPHPPILIGGNGPRLLTLAAREADIVGLSGITFRRDGPDLSAWKGTEIDERIRLVRAAAGEDRYRRLEINALVQRVVVTNDQRQAAEDLATRWPQLNADEILQCPFVLVGSVDQLTEALIRNRDRWDISSYAIFEADIESFAPVVARLAGS